MKKVKIFGILSLLLVAAMLFAACGGEAAGLKRAASYDVVLNPDYNLYTNMKTLSRAIDRLDDYTLTQSNENFAVFEKEDDENPKATNLKVLSLRTGAIIVSQITDEETEYSVSLSETTPTFILCRRYGNNLNKTRYTLYDTAGNAVTSTSSSQGNPSVFADMILYGTTLYKEDENGNLTEVKTISENVSLTAPDDYSEGYFYYTTKYGIDIYDRDFNFTTSWELPHSLAYLPNDEIFQGVLNNGNVLIQYAVQLDDDATKYDYTGVGDEIVKYDLCTLILNAQTGKTTTVETNYVFDWLASEYKLSEVDDANNRRYADGFENIASVRPIENKRINTSSAACSYVLVNNNGKVTTSLKLADYQTSGIPSKLADDTYWSSTEYGTAIVDGKGKTLLSINNRDLTIVGEYIVSERAIYNFSMETVYDLKQNNAKIVSTFDGAILVVEEIKDTTYEILRFRDGEISTVCTIDLSDKTAEDSNNATYDANAGYYAVYRAATDEYTYYNAKGETLLKGDYKLQTTITSHTHGTAILKADTGEYFFFTK